jgi:amino acid transporter/ubiquinone/menaquinone biosynthesis C-methylase UbiE
MFPKAGGVYEYTKKSFGGFIGFAVGWSAWIVANLAIAMLVIAGVKFLSLLVPIDSVMQTVVALGFVLLFNYISFRGIELSQKILVGFSVITIIVVILVIIGALPSVNLNNLHPFFVFGSSSVFMAMFIIMETFFGWEALSFLSEETIDAKRVLPKVMIVSTIIVAVVVLVTVFVSMTAVPWYKLSYSNVNSLDDYYAKSSAGTLQSQPLALIAATTNVFSGPVITAMIILAFLNVIGSAAAWIVSTPRLIFAMAREGDLPTGLRYIHEKYKTPHYAIAFQTLVTIFVLLSGSYELLLQVGVPLAVIMYSFVVISIPILRVKHPDLERAFKLPLPLILPVIAVIAMVVMTVFGSTWRNILLGASLFMLGIPLYIIGSLGYRKEMIHFFSDALAKLTYWTYGAFVEQAAMVHLIDYMEDVTVTKVLDIGCGIGRFTNKIAKHCIPVSGKVYGVDFSKKALEIGRRYARMNDVKNVEFIEADLYNLGANKEVDKKLRQLDGVVGIGVLQYLSDPVAVLQDAYKRLSKGGKFYFIDYDFVSHIFDKPWIEKDESIRKVFGAAGFDVKIWRQKKIFWQYVHIYGEKK